MVKLLYIAFVFMAICCVGCRKLEISDYMETVVSAMSSVKESRDLEEIFPHTDHFITHYNMGGKEWMNSVVYLDGGYVITAQALIRVDYANNTASALEKTKVYLVIVDKIEISKDGSICSSCSSPDVKVTDEVWAKFLESGGDIRILGFDPNRKSPPHWKEYVKAWTGGRLVYKGG